MGQGVSAAAAFGTKVRTTVSVEFQTQGIGAPPSPDDQMTGGAICARLRAPRTTDDLDDLPHLQGAGARVFPIAPRPDFLGGNL